MKKSKFKYIFGPVYSWRLGMSLGIDPISRPKKICNFNCIYCQLGRTAKFSDMREEFVPVEDVVRELKALPPVKVDYYTFSGRGEPTLAKNLGAMIRAVRETTKGKIAVITNAALIGDEAVQDDLMLADFVLLKLDVCGEDSLRAINAPAKDIRFHEVLGGIRSFRRKFKGKFALQIMFIEQNRKYAQTIADIAREIKPDEVQINTPLRPCGVKPLNEKGILEIKKFFKGLSATTVYEAERREILPFDEGQTVLRHGKFKKEAESGK